MLFFSLLMIITSLTITFTSHPVLIMCVILAQTLFICINLWVAIKTSWMSFILFLIFLGGLMVLFVYIVSLAANEKFEPNLKNFSLAASLTLALVACVVLNLDAVNEQFQPQLHSNNMMIFSEAASMVVIAIMSFLLFTLIVAIKISSKYEGPLRTTSK